MRVNLTSQHNTNKLVKAMIIICVKQQNLKLFNWQPKLYY